MTPDTAPTDPGITPGTILAFAGSIIPAGWVVCDGTAGTPDLRELFVPGFCYIMKTVA